MLNKKYSIGILGVGFVGGTHRQAFIDAGLETSLVCVDKKIEGTNVSDLQLCDVIFVCLPSPTTDGRQDLSTIQGALGELATLDYRGVVVIKSTVLPGTCEKFASKYRLRIVHSPEFLKERSALADFKNQSTILLSGALEDCGLVKDVYRRGVCLGRHVCNFLLHPFYVVTETAKYFHNCFLASKVAFANEMFNACMNLGVKYETVKNAAQTQGAIGLNHLDVPGPDGKFGYSGTCFPKDVSAFLSLCPQMKILQAVHDSNQAIRPHDLNCEPL